MYEWNIVVDMVRRGDYGPWSDEGFEKSSWKFRRGEERGAVVVLANSPGYSRSPLGRRVQ